LWGFKEDNKMDIKSIGLRVYKQVFQKMNDNISKNENEITRNQKSQVSSSSPVYIEISLPGQIYLLSQSQKDILNQMIKDQLEQEQKQEFDNLLETINSPEYMKKLSEAGGLAKAEEEAWERYIDFINKVYGRNKQEELEKLIKKTKK
jgi:hypothetical protein